MDLKIEQQLANGNFLVKTPFEFNDQLRGLFDTVRNSGGKPFRKWNGDVKMWEINKTYCDALIEFLKPLEAPQKKPRGGNYGGRPNAAYAAPAQQQSPTIQTQVLQAPQVQQKPNTPAEAVKQLRESYKNLVTTPSSTTDPEQQELVTAQLKRINSAISLLEVTLQ